MSDKAATTSALLGLGIVAGMQEVSATIALPEIEIVIYHNDQRITGLR